MFKIAFIGQKGIPVSQGGVERHVEELSIRMARKGHEVFVYTRPHWVPKEYKKYEGVNLISLPSLNTKHLDAGTHTFISIFSAIFKQKVDIIHLQGVGPGWFAWLPKILSPKIKVVTTIHSADWEHGKWNNFAQMMLKFGAKLGCKFSDEAIAVGRSLQKHCLMNCKKDAIYIPNGVAIPEKNNSKTFGKNILNNFNLTPNQYILTVSRLVKHKGIHYLIEAFKNFKTNLNKTDQARFANFKLVIVGSTAFTENYQKYLLKLTQNREDIIFAGIQTGSNLDALFSNSYLYAQPSESEGLSIALLEAMSYGKSILVSNIEENIELITGNSQTGTIGFDFENKNIADLTKKLTILINDQDIVRQVGNKARNYVKLYYNWEEITDRTERIYKNIVRIKDKMPSRFRFAFSKQMSS
ncbi:glycosyltransferase family 4 protein [Patescibacteria group bacterium]|nr:glycosyltransferase family 4 protein [Patescibacteria group bacterium]